MVENKLVKHLLSRATEQEVLKENMKKVKATIEGREVGLALTPEQEEQIFGDTLLDEVYKFHGITKEQFESAYEKVPANKKAIAQEQMIAEMYNKKRNKSIDPFDEDQYKYYAYFNISNNVFSFRYVNGWCSYLSLPAPLCFMDAEDCKEAADKYFNVYKRSRL